MSCATLSFLPLFPLSFPKHSLFPLALQLSNPSLQVHNESGSKRVVVTKGLPGDRWLKLLTDAGARVEVCTSADTILSVPQIKSLIGDKCDGVIGQLTEVRGNGFIDWCDLESERDLPLFWHRPLFS